MQKIPAGILKHQKACFRDIKRLHLLLITRCAQAIPRDNPRRMVFFGRNDDRGVRQILFGMCSPLDPLLSEEYQVAVQCSFGLPLRVLVRVSWRQDSRSRQQRAVLGRQIRPKASGGYRGQRQRRTHFTWRLPRRSSPFSQVSWHQVL